MSQRICFTELNSSELPMHAARFGPFAIECDVTILRQMGAVPVLYLARSTTGKSDIADALFTRLAAMEMVFRRLVNLQPDLTSPEDPNAATLIELDYVSSLIVPVPVAQTQALIRGVFTGLPDGRDLMGTVQAIFSVISPTERDSTSSMLHDYYSQREWRITSGISGGDLRVPTEDEYAELLEIDSTFFGRLLNFKMKSFTRAKGSLFFHGKNGVSTSQAIRRIWCPEACAEAVTKIIHEAKLSIEVRYIDDKARRIP